MAEGNLKLAVLGLGTMGQAWPVPPCATASRPSYGIAIPTWLVAGLNKRNKEPRLPCQ